MVAMIFTHNECINTTACTMGTGEGTLMCAQVMVSEPTTSVIGLIVGKYSMDHAIITKPRETGIWMTFIPLDSCYTDEDTIQKLVSAVSRFVSFLLGRCRYILGLGLITLGLIFVFGNK